jgi:pimeloyl-ACP methyl ester carboxylesterase
MRVIAQRLFQAMMGLRAMAAFACLFLSAALSAFATPANAAATALRKPTVVLVHGAFAESSSWNPVTARLLAKGYPVIAIAIPLRGVKSDAVYLDKLLGSIDGPVVLVGHSYGGNVISNISTTETNVKALVFVSGVAPDVGESASSLAGKFPGSTLGATLAPPVVLADGSKDLYIQQDKYPAQFCADVPLREAKLMATTQRPITARALDEGGGVPAWKTLPSWFLYGSADRNIPPAVHAFMAKRAGAKQIVEIQGASHVVMISHPEALVKLIDVAAAESVH